MINIERNKLQTAAINDIAIKYYNPNNIFCAEYPTGSGKTKILLEAAKIIQKNNSNSVIISTSNNALVFGFIEEAKKHNMDINNIIVVIGKNNYIDRTKVLDDYFIELSGIQKVVFEDYFNNIGEVEILSYDFINYFNILPELEEIIQQDDDSDYATLEERRENIAVGNKIYITNHHYLISLYRSLKEEHAFTSIPLLVDEAHELHQAAETIFMISFSPHRLSIYINTLLKNSEDFITKKDKNLLYDIKYKTDDLKNFYIHNNSDHDFIDKIKKFSNGDNIKELKQTLLKIGKKKGINFTVKKNISVIEKELNELSNIKYKNDNLIEINIAPIKKYPTIQVSIEDPSFMLRNMVWKKNTGYITLVGGTFCITDSETKSDNNWSFLRLGFLFFMETEDDKRKTYWNIRLALHFIFKVEKPLFDKSQAKYYIAGEVRFLPPSYKIKNDIEKLTNAWIDAIAEEAANKLIYKNTVILMSSFENCEALNEALLKYTKIKDNYKIFYSSPSQTIKQLQNRYMTAINDGYNCILVGNLSFYTGIDLPHHYLNTLLIGKLPFEPNRKFFTRFKVANSISQHFNNIFKAILLFRQGLGRGLRSENDRVFIGILDPRILKARYKPFLYFLERMAEKI